MKNSKFALRLIACLVVAGLVGLPTLAELHHVEAASSHADVSPLQSVRVQSPANTTSIGSVLNPDGTLNLTEGFSGALNPAGYTMQTGPDGEPRFVPDPAGTGDKGDKPPSEPPLDAPVGSYTWDSRFNPIGPGSRVNAVAIDGATVYVGGSFVLAGKTPANNVARWDGSQWNALGSGTDDTILTMDFAAGNLYVGGDFTHAGGISAQHIARWDGSAWHALGSGINSEVIRVIASGATVYAGGGFTTAGGISASKIARWDGSAWHALGTGITGLFVLSILINGSDVYVGGNFYMAGSTAVHSIARWDGTSWYDVNGGVSGIVLDLAIFGTDLYVGGEFNTPGSGGQLLNNIARYSTIDNLWYPLGEGVGGQVESIVHSTIGYGLYVAGNFTTAGTLPAKGIAMWSTSGGGWSVLGIASSNGFYGGHALDLGMTANGYLYAGGIFDTAGGVLGNGGVVANNIARWYGGAWSALGSGLGVASSTGKVLAVLASTIGGTTTVYVGGTFQSVGSLPANNIAKWDGTAWSTLGSGANNGVDRTVNVIAQGSGATIYVGGDFTRAGGITVNKVARWSSGLGWAALNQGVSGGSVRALAYNNYDLYLYVGGDFTQAGGSVSVNSIARWNSSGGSNSWSPLKQGTTSVNGVNGTVTTIAIRDSNGKVYVGGTFDHAGGLNASNLADWGANGTANFWHITGTANGSVNSLVFLDDTLYAGGAFTSIYPGGSANHVAKYNFGTSGWSALGSGTSNGVNGEVHALAVSGSTLRVGGAFTMAGGTAVNNITSWNGSAWSALGSGVTDDYMPLVSALAADGTTLFVGGTFDMAGGKPSTNFARYYYVPPPPLP